MALTEGMRLLQEHLLILLLGVMVVMSEAGIYRMASSVMLFVAMPISLFNIVGMPIIARLHAIGEHSKLQRMLSLVAIGMTLGVALLSTPFLISGEWILTTVFGPDFREGNRVLSVLCVAVLVNAFFGANAAVLNMTGHQSKVTLASFFALVALLVGAVPLITFFGAFGAAVSSLISLTVWNVSMWRYANKNAQLDTSVLSFFRRGKGNAE